MAMKDVIQVERRVQSLIHSARTERRMVWRPWMCTPVRRGKTLLAALAVVFAGAWKTGVVGALAVMAGLSVQEDWCS